MTDAGKPKEGATRWAVEYSYKADGHTFSRTAHVTGTPPDALSHVYVLYAREEPSFSRIVNDRRSRVGLVVMIIVLLSFPVGGLVPFAIAWRKGARVARLLRLGRHAKGKLLGKTETSTRLGHLPIYELTFSFQAEDGATYKASAKTPHLGALEDEDQTSLLYDPDSPNNATLLAHLPGSPRITDDDDITSSWSPRDKSAIVTFVLLTVVNIVVAATALQ